METHDLLICEVVRAIADADLFDGKWIPEKFHTLHYLNECAPKKGTDVLLTANNQHATCQAHVELEFANLDGAPSDAFSDKLLYAQERSKVFVELEKKLQRQ